MNDAKQNEEPGTVIPLKNRMVTMVHEDIELIKHRVLSQLHDAEKKGRKPESIKASPENYHRFLVAFMHQLRISDRGVELFGIPLIIEQHISEVGVVLK